MKSTEEKCFCLNIEDLEKYDYEIISYRMFIYLISLNCYKNLNVVNKDGVIYVKIRRINYESVGFSHIEHYENVFYKVEQ